eukprot:5714738-Lingulodinium_polyedra.AAC.1
MQAFLHVLQALVPPARVLTDHLAMVQALGKGRRWCVSAKRAHADIWRGIWEKLEDMGFPDAGLELLHVKAHRAQK